MKNRFSVWEIGKKSAKRRKCRDTTQFDNENIPFVMGYYMSLK